MRGEVMSFVSHWSMLSAYGMAEPRLLSGFSAGDVEDVEHCSKRRQAISGKVASRRPNCHEVKWVFWVTEFVIFVFNDLLHILSIQIKMKYAVRKEFVDISQAFQQ